MEKEIMYARELNGLEEKVREFAKAIVESDEYKKYMQYSNLLMNDQKSRRLLAQYQSRERRLKLGRFGPGLIDELMDLHIKVSNNELIQSYNRSGNELMGLLLKTNELISERIGREFAYDEGGSCCG